MAEIPYSDKEKNLIIQTMKQIKGVIKKKAVAGRIYGPAVVLCAAEIMALSGSDDAACLGEFQKCLVDARARIKAAAS